MLTFWGYLWLLHYAMTWISFRIKRSCSLSFNTIDGNSFCFIERLEGYFLKLWHKKFWGDFCLLFACALSMCKFSGQKKNPHHRSDPSCCSDNVGYLTCCITRELHVYVYYETTILWCFMLAVDEHFFFFFYFLFLVFLFV